MASPFYNRYVPPQPKNPDRSELVRPAKKRKKSKSAPSKASEQAKPLEESRESVPPHDHNDEEPIVASKDTSAGSHEVAIRDRHKMVLDKYEEATKNSAGLTDERTVADAKDETKSLRDEMEIEVHGLEPLPQPEQVKASSKVSLFSALPEWLQAPTLVKPTDTVLFDDLPLDKDTTTSLEKRGYSTAFAIQSALLPLLLPGPRQHYGDVCISAATGSGKTLAYILPMVQNLRNKPVTRLRGLIVVPTRELVNQVRDTLDLCSASSGLKVGTAVGSKSLKEEQMMLVEKGQRYDPEAYQAEQEKEIDEEEDLMDWDFDKKFDLFDDLELFYNHVVEYTSKIDILICTPGRLVDHIQSTTGFTLQHVQWLVIDEADRLLDESFQQWVDIVLPGLKYQPPNASPQSGSSIPYQTRRRDVRNIVLSATMTRDISKLMALDLRRPKLVVLEGQNQKSADEEGGAGVGDERGTVEVPATLEEYGVPISELTTQDKPLYLLELLDPTSGPSISKKQKSSTVLSKRPEASDGDGSTDSESLSQDSESSSSDDNVSSQTVAGNKVLNYGTLIFTESNEQAVRLARLLTLLRPSWQIGTLTKSTAGASGRKTLAAFRKRKLSILIASDRASRGLDIPDLAQVVNYDMPKSATSYVHRVGRTARAGKAGQAVTLVLHNQGKWFWKDKSGIAKSDMLIRGPERRVIRRNLVVKVSEEEREKYEKALQTLGEEARA